MKVRQLMLQNQMKSHMAQHRQHWRSLRPERHHGGAREKRAMKIEHTRLKNQVKERLGPAGRKSLGSEGQPMHSNLTKLLKEGSPLVQQIQHGAWYDQVQNRLQVRMNRRFPPYS